MKKLHIILLVALSIITIKANAQLNSMRDLNYAFETKFITLSDEVELAYVEEGSADKPTILFIHGLGSYLPAWRKTISGLKEDFHCIAIDLPGYGKSSKGNYPITLPWFADKVKEFIEAKNLQNVTIAGHSMGGQIAILTGLAYPEIASQLILVAPAGFETFHEGQKEWFREVMSARAVKLTTVDAIKTNYAYNFYNMPKDARFMVEDRIAMRSASDFDAYCYAIPESVKAMVDYPVFDHLKELKMPVLVIYGKNDQLIPNRYLNPGTTKAIAESGTEQIPNATLAMINKAGHFVQFEQADVVNQTIKEFMTK